jgi:hypothetical protein
MMFACGMGRDDLQLLKRFIACLGRCLQPINGSAGKKYLATAVTTIRHRDYGVIAFFAVPGPCGRGQPGARHDRNRSYLFIHAKNLFRAVCISKTADHL